MRAALRTLAAGLAAGLLWASAAAADEVRFNNGDRLTGTIVSADGGKLKLKSAVAGTVEVSLSDVKTFRSDGPLDIALKDGTALRQPVAAADQPGRVTLRPGAADADTLPIASIRSINPKGGWSGTVVAGALISRGNSDTDAFNVGVDAARRTAVDRLNLSGQYLFDRQRDEGTGE